MRSSLIFSSRRFSFLAVLILISSLSIAGPLQAQTCPGGSEEGGFIVFPTIVASTTQISCITLPSTGFGTVTTTLTIAFQCEWGNCGAQTKDFQFSSVGSGQCVRRGNELGTICAPLHTSIIVDDTANARLGWIDATFGESQPCYAAPLRYDRFSCPKCLTCIDTGDGGGRSPILISLRDGRFELTDFEGGVSFDLDHNGFAEKLSWTAPGSDEGFLALDRNGNGVIDGGNELFGDVTPQPEGGVRNGFRALALFDDPFNGGNDDGMISALDDIFSELRIWLDENHNGISEAREISPLSAFSIAIIGLDFIQSQRRDRHGNEFRFRGQLELSNGAKRPVWDVFFLVE